MANTKQLLALAVALFAVVATAGAAFVDPAAAQDSANAAFRARVDQYLSLQGLQDPAGTYHGTKDVLGENVDATIVVVSSTEFDLTISGVIKLSCNNEDYTFSNGVITPLGINTDGDCIHDALAANKVTLESITYDASSDSITVTVKYEIFKVEVVLAHVSSSVAHLPLAPRAAALEAPVLPALYRSYYKLFLLQDPSGVYEGSKTILGQKLDATVNVKSSSAVDFSVSGIVSVSCKDEAYTYSNGVISITNVGKKGDCLHDALEANGASLESVTYDQSADEVDVKLKKAFLSVSLELHHVA